jgi:hypothetical protein
MHFSFITEYRNRYTLHYSGFGRYYRTQKSRRELKNECAAYFLKTTRSSAAELSLANTELEFENKEKKRRAAELVINNRTCFQNEQRKACRLIAKPLQSEESKTCSRINCCQRKAELYLDMAVLLCLWIKKVMSLL